MKVYVIKIAVRGVSPMVWRRLRIAADTSLAALHFIIQIIQGWGDDHLHQFHIYGKDYGIQQIFFLSDGADNLRELQFGMYPESIHVLDWFHITMRLTVLMQYAKGLQASDPATGSKELSLLESSKRYLWHGNIATALDRIDDCVMYCDDPELNYANLKVLQK